MARVPGIDIPIRTEDDTAAGLSSVKKSLTGTLGQIGKVAAGMLTADLVRNIGQFGQEALKAGADAEVMMKSFDALRKASGNMDTTIGSLREATGGLVSDVQLATAANQFMNLNLPTGGMEDMWAAAQKLGRAMGMDAASSIRDFNTAVGRASPLILDNFGISLSAAEAQREYAASIGKTAAELTESEKKVAFQTIAIEKLMEKASVLGDNTSAAGDAWARFGATMDNFKASVGQALLPVLDNVLSVLNDIMPTVQGLIDAIRGGDWDQVSETISDAFTAAGQAVQDVIDNIDWEKVFTSLGQFAAEIPFILAKGLFNLGGVLGKVIADTDWNAVFSGMWEGWANFIGSFVERIAENLWQLLPKALRDLLGPGQGTSGGPGEVPGSTTTTAPGGIPGLARGGIVNRPTLAMIGEAGPEAVVPLNGNGAAQGDFAGGGVRTIVIEKLFEAENVVLDPANLTEVTDKILSSFALKLQTKGIRLVNL